MSRRNLASISKVGIRIIRNTFATEADNDMKNTHREAGPGSKADAKTRHTPISSGNMSQVLRTCVASANHRRENALENLQYGKGIHTLGYSPYWLGGKPQDTRGRV